MSEPKLWDGRGVWSSQPVANPAALNRQSFTEVLCLLHWDERFARAFRRAHREYIAAGSPGVPMNSTDYRKAHALQQQPGGEG